MADLAHLFKVKQKVKYHDPDTGKWHNGEIKKQTIKIDLVILN